MKPTLHRKCPRISFIKSQKTIKARVNQARKNIDAYEEEIEKWQKELDQLRKECKHENTSHEFSGCDWYTDCEDCGATLK